MSWTSAKELKAKLLKMWDSGKLLRSEQESEELFPLTLKLRGPTSLELSSRFAEVSDWIARWQEEGVQLVWRRTHHRIIGANEIPTHAVFTDLDEVCRFLKTIGDLKVFRHLVETTQATCPALIPWLFRRPLTALQHALSWERLLRIVNWRASHPRPELYLRQVELPGVDTKFFEHHKGVLSELFELALVSGEVDPAASGFERRYGFRERPVRLRWRPLAEGAQFRGFTELTVTRDDFVRTDPGFSRVVVVENEINFLTFPPVDDAMIIFGSGFKVGALKEVPWMAERELFYWGDIDTHGFAILDQFRSYYPQTRSLLMDRATFLAHDKRWVKETRQTRALLTHLSPEEHSLYQDLLHEEYGPNLRLEQELIEYCYVKGAALLLARTLKDYSGGSLTTRDG